MYGLLINKKLKNQNFVYWIILVANYHTCRCCFTHKAMFIYQATHRLHRAFANAALTPIAYEGRTKAEEYY